MKPHLIIDFRDRCLFSLLIDHTGNIRPCTHSVGEQTLKYFFGEIFLDSGIYLDLNEEQTHNLFSKFEKNELDFFRSGKEIGWMWPYQLEIDKTAIPLKNPLNILSSVYISDSDAVNRLILRVSDVILEFLLEPIIRFLRENEFVLKEINVTAIVPGYFSRRARLMLHLVLRRMEFNKTAIIAREVATAMACLESLSFGSINILDMENENTHLYQLEIKNIRDSLEMACSNCGTIPQLGWRSITRKLGDILFKQKKIEDRSGIYRALLDKAFLGLIFGVISTGIPSKPPTNLTQKLVNQLLKDSKKLIWQDEAFEKLKGLLATIKREGEMMLPIGMPFMLRGFENEILRDFNTGQLSEILTRLPLERTAYGLAIGFRWLSHNPDRKIKIFNPSTLRIVTGSTGSVELISQKLLPMEPGDKRVIKQIFGVHLGENVSEDTIYFNIQWGNSTNPKANMNVCLLSINAEPKDMENKSSVLIILELQKAKVGKDLIGNVSVELGEKRESRKFTIDNQNKEIGFEYIN